MGFPEVDRMDSFDEPPWVHPSSEALDLSEDRSLFDEQPTPLTPVNLWEEPGVEVEQPRQIPRLGEREDDPVVTRVRRRTLIACLCWIFGTTLGLFGVPLMIEATCHLSAFGTLLSGLLLARTSLKEPKIQVVLIKDTNKTAER